jgi:2,3-diaminopropionate biosynthesis protein SbnA
VEVYDNILATIGKTPLVRLQKLYAGESFRVYAKLEALNPGGSIKDRPAQTILEAALREGRIGPHSTIIESSSGNLGIGLAQACRYHDLRFICVVDPKTAAQNLRLLQAYGAEVDMVTAPCPATGEFLRARIDRVQQLLREIGDSFWPNQYENPWNPESHYRTTMAEIAAALDGRVDYLFIATSTCGTIRGCAEYIRDHGLGTRVVAVDALGSLIFSDFKTKRMIPGMGASIKPPLCDLSLIDEVVHVTDTDCVAGCRRLVATEGILSGGSSGGVIAALERLRDRLPAGANCVAVLCDRGERYLDTIYDDGWVQEHCAGAEIDHLGLGQERNVSCTKTAS